MYERLGYDDDEEKEDDEIIFYNLYKMKNITIPYGEFVKEHMKLINVLKDGDKKAQMKEAQNQKKELKGIFKVLKNPK